MLWNQEGLCSGTRRDYALEPGGIMLWNQNETDTGFILFAGMARSYSPTIIRIRSRWFLAPCSRGRRGWICPGRFRFA